MSIDLSVGNLVEAVGGRRWDRRQIGREVATRVARFQARGVGRGDRVFLHFGNRLEFFAELLALWRLGACAVPVDARLTAFEVRTLVAAATPRLAVVDDATDGRVAQALIDAGVGVVGTTETGTMEATAAASRLDDDALILFTSGSTGEPKGVLHTHRSLRARWISLRDALGTAAFARTLCLLPTHFGHGLICNCLFPWLSGQDLILSAAVPPRRHRAAGRDRGRAPDHLPVLRSRGVEARAEAVAAAALPAACSACIAARRRCRRAPGRTSADGRACARCAMPMASPRPEAGSPGSATRIARPRTA